MTIDRQQLVDEVMWRTGLRDCWAAEVAVEWTLEALGERLAARDSDALARVLPASFAAALLRLHRHTAFKPTALFARVSVSEGLSKGAAREHAEVVCRPLAGALGVEERRLLERRLPPEWSSLFAR